MPCYLILLSVDSKTRGLFHQHFASSPKYSLKICVLQKSYFLWEFQLEISAWNSHHKCDIWHRVFSWDYSEELAKSANSHHVTRQPHFHDLTQLDLTFWNTNPPGFPQPNTGSVEGAALTLGCELMVSTPIRLRLQSSVVIFSVSEHKASSFHGSLVTCNTQKNAKYSWVSS